MNVGSVLRTVFASRATVVWLAGCLVLAVFLFATRPPELPAETTSGRKVPIEKVFRILAAENDVARGMYTADIVTAVQLPDTMVCNATLWAACIGGAAQRDNYRQMIEAAGLQVKNIVKTMVFVKDLNDFATINAVYEAFFAEHNADFPARSCVEVARLPKDAGIEIEAIAVA